MISLLSQGYYAAFFLIIAALVFSLSFHEYGHAFAAYRFGDDTAKRAGRLTINPLVHIDPLGLMMVIFVGFGFARPVPIDPRKFNSFWGQLTVAAAGPAMNLLVALISVNLFVYGKQQGWEWLNNPGVEFFFIQLSLINMLLMLFNLLPIGALDGHYILPYFLPRRWVSAYHEYNARYGNMLLLGLLVASIAGLPIFRFLFAFGQGLLGYIIFV